MEFLTNILKKCELIKKREQRCHSSKGGVFVETALTLPIFLILVFMIIELMMYSYASLTAQYVVSTVMRKFATHGIESDGIGNEIKNSAKSFGIIALSSSESSDVTNSCEEKSLLANKNSYCLTNVSVFAATKSSDTVRRHLGEDNSPDYRYGDLYSLNWSFQFPMTSWFLLLGNPDNQGWRRNVTISASASARLEPTTN